MTAEIAGNITIFSDEVEGLGTRIREAEKQNTDDVDFGQDIITILQDYTEQ